MKNTCALSIVIPAYNEAQRILPVLERLAVFAETRSCEIVVVDDGSSDGTAELVERWIAGRSFARVIRKTPNRGKGSAVRTGMLAARGDVRIMYDADGSIDVDHVPALLGAMQTSGCEIAIGSRRAPGAIALTPAPAWRRVWSRLVNKLVIRQVAPGIADTQCGFKAFTAEAALDLFSRASIDGWAFDLEILAMAPRRGWRIVEVGITWHDDPRSHVRPLHDLIKVIKEIVAIKRRLSLETHCLPSS